MTEECIYEFPDGTQCRKRCAPDSNYCKRHQPKPEKIYWHRRGGSGKSLLAIEGIGPAYAARLRKAGVRSTTTLLAKGATPQSRKEIAEKTGLGESLILRWVNHADLFRIKGVGGQYAELLEAAGVDTVVELAQRNAGNLHQTLIAANEEQQRVRKLPTLKESEAWVKQAKRLTRTIKY